MIASTFRPAARTVPAACDAVDMNDFTRAALVRPGTFAEVARLARLGGRILSHGSHHDASGAIWPCVAVRLGRLSVVIVLCGADAIGERQRHPPGAVAVWPVERVERRAA